MKIRTAAIALACLSIINCGIAAQQEDPALKEAFRKCAQISDDIAEIRELDFKRKVTVKVQTKEDFVKYIDKEIGEQYGSDSDIDSYVDALVLLGALKEKVEFGETLKEMMISQAAAHYDPRNDIYYLLMGDAPPMLLDIISSHELCHALQDQHFDLETLIMNDPKAMRDNGDTAMAKQCIAEGDATLVMLWWAMASQMPNAQKAQLSAQVSLAAGMQASMDFDMMKSLMDQGAGSGMSVGSIAGSIDDLEKFPRFFMESLLMAYTQGSLAVDHVRTRGGWQAVNELFTNPPSSTEQILHPEKLVGERDEPVDIRLSTIVSSPPKGWMMAEEDVLGELGTRIMLAAWSDNSAAKNEVSPAIAARGWDGDRYYYFKKGDAQMLVWKSTWDSEKDAEEFTSALITNLKTRYPSLKQKKSKDTVLANDKRRLRIRSKGKDVLLINSPANFDHKALLKQIAQ